MGSWDELCLLCGISPFPPGNIYGDPGCGAQALAEELLKYDPTLLDDMKFDQDALEALLGETLDIDEATNWDTRPGWRWDGFMQCIAIGHFKEDGDTPHEIVQTDTGCVRRIPDGKYVETRLVTDTDCGEFGFVVHRKLDEDGNIIETKEEKLSRTGSSNYIHRELAREEISTGNFFPSEGCFHYLQAWLDYCRVPKPHHDRKLTFSGELFEIVSSRKGRDYTTGALPYINYDGIENTLQQEQYEASENMKVPECTIASIRNGDPPHQILDSISRDCRAWMFRAPDMWPVADEDLVREVASKFTPANAIDILRALPNEVVFYIIQFVDSIQTYLALAKTSKWLYNELNDPFFRNYAFRTMARSPSGCLFWTQPVASMQGEVKKAYTAAASFLGDMEVPTSDSPFFHRDFPWLYFLRLCWQSDSMRNRKRLWGQVKQMEEVWIKYRIHGWEVDRFGVPLE